MQSNIFLVLGVFFCVALFISVPLDSILKKGVHWLVPILSIVLSVVFIGLYLKISGGQGN